MHASLSDDSKKSVNLSMLVDTGAGVSLISASALASLTPCMYPVERSGVSNLVGADGKPIELLGTVDLFLTFGSSPQLPITLVVAKSCCVAALLGADFLSAHKAVLDFRGKPKLSFSCGDVVLSATNHPDPFVLTYEEEVVENGDIAATVLENEDKEVIGDDEVEEMEGVVVSGEEEVSEVKEEEVMSEMKVAVEVLVEEEEGGESTEKEVEKDKSVKAESHGLPGELPAGSCVNGVDQGIAVCLARKVVLPAASEVVLPGVLRRPASQPPSDAVGMLTPNKLLIEKRGLVCASVLTKPSESNVVPVRILNPFHEDVELPRHTCVGRWTEVPEDCIVREDSSAERPSGFEPEAAIAPPETNVQDRFDWSSFAGSSEQKDHLLALLVEFGDVIATDDQDVGNTTLTSHCIDVQDAAPIRQAARRLPIHKRSEVKKHLDQMLAADVIEPSSSPWSSPIVLVKKADGSTRFCVDYRALNSVTRKDAYPLPRIDETLDSLGQAKYFSTLDLQSGYWQVEVDEHSRDKTAFATPFGLYQFRRMPFGLTNAPATFQRLMEAALHGLSPLICLVYLDDIIVFSSTFEEHLSRLRTVFTRLRQAGLKLKPRKCKLLCSLVRFLGHVVSDQGVATDPEKIRVVAEWPRPTDVAGVRSFLGLAGYYRRFVKDFASVARPLNRLLEKSQQFCWGSGEEVAFEHLKHALTTAPVLSFPNLQQPFIVDTDASDYGLGAVLSQVDPESGLERVVCFASRTLNRAERRYATTRKEMLAVVWALKVFRAYLLGSRFLVRTDHNSLVWLMKFKEPPGQVARWIETLAEYDFVIEHRPGRQHSNADALSRRAATDEGCPPEPVMAMAVRFQADPAHINKLRLLTQKDADLSVVMERLTAGKDRFIQGDSPMVRRLLLQSKALKMDNGLLYRELDPVGAGRRPVRQLVVPKAMRVEVFEEAHAGSVSGHFASKRTLGRIREHAYWPGMTRDVEEWYKACPTCACRRQPRQNRLRAPMGHVAAAYPFERVAVDLMGPLPETDGKNKYILAIVDYFSKWLELLALPDIKAETIAVRLVEDVFSRYGLPESLHSDQGSQFESALFQEVCKLFGIQKTRTTPYHPQGDGLVERANRTVKEVLTAYTSEHQRDWDCWLPQTQLAYNTSEHSSTGYTPYFLLFGREARLPLDVLVASPHDQPVPQSLPEYVVDLRSRQTEAFERVRETLEVSHRRQKSYYDRSAGACDLAVGSKVWLYSSAVKRGRSPKFHRPWGGPWIIVGRPSNAVYKIRRDGKLRRGERRRLTVNRDRLKPCTLPDPPAETGDVRQDGTDTECESEHE